MINTTIQVDLLSEVRTSQQVLKCAINVERANANQSEYQLQFETSSLHQTEQKVTITTTTHSTIRKDRTLLEMHQSIYPQPTLKLSSKEHHMQKLQKRRALCLNVQSHDACTYKTARSAKKRQKYKTNTQATTHQEQHRTKHEEVDTWKMKANKSFCSNPRVGKT